MVKKTNGNINKYHHDRLPEPEIPADQAWAQMNDVLGPGVTPVKDPGAIAGLMKHKWVFLSTCAAIFVSTIILIRTLHHPSEGLKLRGTDTKGAPIAGNGKETRRTGHAAGPGKSNEITIEAKGPAPYQGHRDGTIASAANAATRQTRKAGSGRQAESTQTTEPTVPEGYMAAEPERSAKDLRNSGWSKGMRPVNTLINHLLQNNRPLTVDGNNRGGTVTLESKNERADEAAANPAIVNPGNGPGARTELPTITFLKPASKTDRPYQPETAIAPPPYPGSPLTHRQIRSMHFGPEWGMNSPLTHTDYLFTGKDSVNRPALLLIPGIFVSKSWPQHAVSLTFSPYQSYFGNGEIVAHAIDSTLSGDSLKTYNNLRLMKASGLNFSLYYHYRVTKVFALGAGASYSFFSNALVRKEIENHEGRTLPGALVNLTKPAGLAGTVNHRFFALKAGILLNPGRLQVGLNVIVPVTRVSRINQEPLKPLNGQLFLRFNCW